MIITINDTFFIEKDAFWNHTLKEKKISNTGKEYTSTHGHFRTTEQALTALKHVAVLESHTELTLTEYINEMKKQQTTLLALLNATE